MQQTNKGVFWYAHWQYLIQEIKNMKGALEMIPQAGTNESMSIQSWNMYGIATGVQKTLGDLSYASNYLGRKIALIVRESSNITARICRSPDALKNTIWGTVACMNATHLFNEVVVSKKAIETIGVIGDFIATTRIIQSLDYFCTKKFIKDGRIESIFKIVGELCFFCCRVGDTLLWSAKHKLIDLGNLAVKTGSISIFGARLIVTAMTPLQVFAIGGMIGYILEDLRNLIKAQDVAYHAMDLANEVIGVTFMACLIVGGCHPLVIAALEVAAAGTAILSFFLDPEVGKS